MKQTFAAAMLTTWILTVQLSARTYSPQVVRPAKPPAGARQAHEVATHATKGVVKTVSATTIVITRRTAGKSTDTSFLLTAATQRVGTVSAGATVEIRYRTDGPQRIATAVSVETPLQ